MRFIDVLAIAFIVVATALSLFVRLPFETVTLSASLETIGFGLLWIGGGLLFWYLLFVRYLVVAVLEFVDEYREISSGDDW